ncbi:hypothetical protein LCGC14_1693340 [marine sediment metagenome]|uniref:DUF6788 domain-containing protein n=1 Tax=marine sediment metagenome TaxID=412755 RepID=A0A0F9K0P5_9ZZZZ
MSSIRNLNDRMQTYIEEYQRLTARLSETGFIWPGHIQRRYLTCGKPNCVCHTDPEARHGPYHEWSRREGDRLVHSIVSSSEARVLGRAIRNYRAIKRLLKNWQDQSVKAILTGKGPAPKRKS